MGKFNPYGLQQIPSSDRTAVLPKFGYKWYSPDVNIYKLNNVQNIKTNMTQFIRREEEEKHGLTNWQSESANV